MPADLDGDIFNAVLTRGLFASGGTLLAAIFRDHADGWPFLLWHLFRLYDPMESVA